MTSQSMNKYETVIGLEIHAQISAKTKMFCSCSNDSFSKEPNINVCPICMGFPGVLPAINKEAVEKGIRAALALNCRIKSFSKFDRKNYFYPDLPKGYQISQYDQPLSENGYLEIKSNEGLKKIGIVRVHLEDDAGKLTHIPGGTLCDYNRSGSPLMEIVSAPDLASPGEASLYAREIQKILRVVKSSDCDMEKGMMRFDINVSIRPKGQKEFGVKAEIKNLNSFRALEKCLEYEIKRQTEAVENSEKIIQETRGWDDEKEITYSQRTKEEAHDYRYFPEPDLPPLTISDEYIATVQNNLPELPNKIYDRFINDYHLSAEDAELLVSDIALANYFENINKIIKNPQKVAPWVISYLMKYLKADKISINDCKIKPEAIADLIKTVEAGTLSNNIAKEQILPEMYRTGKQPDEIIQNKGYKQVNDSASLEEVCKKIIADNPVAVAEFKAGKEKSFGFLIGQAMKETKGQANPHVVNELMKKILSN